MVNRRLFIVSLVIVAVSTALLVRYADEIAEWFRPYKTEQMTFQTNLVEPGRQEEPVKIAATLYYPKATQGPTSSVIIMPSSSGVETAREIYYAKELAKTGIAALVVDSFASRGLKSSVYDQSALETWDMENDAVAALRYLRADNRFNPKRIAVMGASKGGTVAMDTATAVRRKWMQASDEPFAAHIAITPDCTWVTKSAATTGKPLFFMLAELDTTTPAQPCLARAQRMLDAGNKNVKSKVYAGAHHAWEELGPKPLTDPEAENFSQCFVSIEDDGTMYSTATGNLVPEDNWHDWAQQNCMTLGTVCCGGTHKLKEEATRDIIAFLREHGF